MFFMAKSALCIGVVAVLAAGVTGRGGIRDAVESGGREAAASLGRACVASKDCLALGSRVAAAAIGQSDARPEALLQAGIARAPDALSSPASPATIPEVARPPRRAERRVRGSVASRG